jgi:hypothetical protein
VEDFEGRIVNAVERLVSHSDPTLADAEKKNNGNAQKTVMSMASLGRFCSKTPCAARRFPRAEQRVFVLSRSDISLKKYVRNPSWLSFDRITRVILPYAQLTSWSFRLYF